MGVAITAGIGAPARRRRLRVGAVPAAPAVPTVAPVAVPARAARTPATPKLGPISKAGGAFPVDWARARADAATTLARMDLSKPNLVIWVPGTSNTRVHPAFERDVRAAYGDSLSLGKLDYEASWHLRRSVATGLATLLLVLEELRRRGISPDRIRLAGESQGAWIVGEAMANPQLGNVAARAVLLGHPWLAAHQYTQGQDPRVQVINHVGDQVTLPVQGSPADGLDAMVAIRTLQLAQLGTVVRALAANPSHGVKMLANIVYAVPGLKTIFANPHVYDRRMPDAIEFLRDGTPTASVQQARSA